MDTQTMLNMLSGMLDKMSDDEINTTLKSIKTMVSPQDFEKIQELVSKRRH